MEPTMLSIGGGSKALFFSTAADMGTLAPPAGLELLDTLSAQVTDLYPLVGDSDERRGTWVSPLLFLEVPRELPAGTVAWEDDRVENVTEDVIDDYAAPGTVSTNILKSTYSVGFHALAGIQGAVSNSLVFAGLDVAPGSLLSEAILYKRAKEAMMRIKDRRAAVVAQAAASGSNTLTPTTSQDWPQAGLMRTHFEAGLAQLRISTGLTSLSRSAIGLLLIGSALDAALNDAEFKVWAQYKVFERAEDGIRQFLRVGEVTTVESPRYGTEASWPEDAWMYLRNASGFAPGLVQYTYSKFTGERESVPHNVLHRIYPVLDAYDMTTVLAAPVFRIRLPATGV